MDDFDLQPLEIAGIVIKRISGRFTGIHKNTKSAMADLENFRGDMKSLKSKAEKLSIEKKETQGTTPSMTKRNSFHYRLLSR